MFEVRVSLSLVEIKQIREGVKKKPHEVEHAEVEPVTVRTPGMTIELWRRQPFVIGEESDLIIRLISTGIGPKKCAGFRVFVQEGKIHFDGRAA